MYWRLLRYRVALTLVLFFLLGITFHQKLTQFSPRFLLAVPILFSSYVCATSLNDIADRKIDKVNHKGNPGRPLITGEATERRLYSLALLAASASLLFGLLISPRAAALVLFSLSINWAYSMPPLRLSYRTHFVPLILSLAYVFVPYSLGVEVAGASFGRGDALFVSALLLLFFGRIILKDFRDRKGDAMYGKPTFLLVYGKDATCAASLLSISAGCALLAFSIPGEMLLMAVALSLFFPAMLYVFHLLVRKARTTGEELLPIALGAKLGNGLLLCVLAMLVLSEYGAPFAARLMAVLSVSLTYVSNFIFAAASSAKSADVLSGYRG